MLEPDEDGSVLNAKYAEKRVTDYLRQYVYQKFSPSQYLEANVAHIMLC
ncbi:DUF7677 family protein [Pectobacterium brasiliense]